MEFMIGHDISTLLSVEQAGGKFYDNGVEADALEILRRYGGNYVRLRLWNDPYTEDGTPYGAGTCDIEVVLKLARRAKDKGMKWLLDFHYSDFWADPGKQYPPKAWQGFDAAQLEQAVYDYTKETILRCAAEGLTPDMVQVGNEITNGLMWPLGRKPEFDNIARFVKAGVRAVRETAPGAIVMVHLDNGGNNPMYREWFDNFFARGGECDVIGLSYYPTWHGTMEELRTNMMDIGPRYGKPLIIVEASNAFTMESYAAYEKREERKGAATRPEVQAKVPYEATPDGQAKFTRDLLDILAQVPDNRGAGIFWWESAWIPVPGVGWAEEPGWTYVHEKGPGGNEWANQCLFDFDGNALPALKVLRDYKGA